jgi:putative addiction module component (TIGR02574 family)
VTELRGQVLALPLEERVKLARDLWESLGESPGDTLDEAAFKEELLRRSADPSPAIPFEEGIAEARRRLGC